MSDFDLDAFLASDFDIDAFIKFASPSLFDPLAGMDFTGLCKGVKPTPRRDIDKNQLMPLAEVARVSGLSLSALRTEARKGTLPWRASPARTSRRSPILKGWWKHAASP